LREAKISADDLLFDPARDALLGSRAFLFKDVTGFGPLEFWNLPRSLWPAAAALLALALALPLYRLTTRMRRGATTSLRVPYVGLVLLGLAWWLWLQAGPAGLLLALWGCILQAIAWRRGAEPIAANPVQSA
jgi:hypothetical protein